MAAAAPDLVSALVLVNPATSFGDSLGGLASLITSTNLLGLFPEAPYALAQGVMQARAPAVLLSKFETGGA